MTTEVGDIFLHSSREIKEAENFCKKNDIKKAK